MQWVVRGLFCLWLLLALLGAAAVAGIVVVRSPALTDAILWRVDSLSGMPTLTQRIYEKQLVRHHLVQDRLIPTGSVLFFGDSHLQALPVGVLAEAYNFAVGGETAQRLASRMGAFRSLPGARAVVLGAGTNDLLEGHSVAEVAASWQRLLGNVPPSVAVVCVGIPLNRATGAYFERVNDLNRTISEQCQARRGKFIAVVPGEGHFAAAGFLQDGVHLDAAGAMLLLNRIQSILIGRSD